jgi:recombination protein RecA
MATKTRMKRARIDRLVKSLGGELVAAGGVRLISPRADLRPRVISSGNDAVDAIIGIGGYPEGRVVIIHGPEASGKTTLLLEAIATCQAEGGVGIFLDFEHKLDLGYAKSLGVDVDSLVLAGPPYIEKGFELIEAILTKLGGADNDVPVVIGWDSLQAAIGLRTFKGDWDTSGFPPEAQAYSRGFARIVPVLSRTRAIMIGISQVRMKLEGWGSREKVGVGNAPLFFATLILKVKPVKTKGAVKRDLSGEMIEVLVRKNQVAAPYGRVTIPVVYGHGTDGIASLFEAAKIVGAIKPKPEPGGYYSIALDDGVFRFQGGSALAAMVKTDPVLVQAIRDHVRSLIGSTSGSVDATVDEEITEVDLDDDDAGEE